MYTSDAFYYNDFKWRASVFLAESLAPRVTRRWAWDPGAVPAYGVCTMRITCGKGSVS